ncbi:hypothetical protein M0R04_03750 [Candidatus Dojkabacteria bacterium]|jgi:hypothetical protein|nr:hypothetical protein [Candidatus Dojkabacteria bacterium]
MRKYKGQALAIVMVVLVIASVIGLAMFSRVMKDNARIINEKSSAEAFEVTNSALDAIKGTTVASIKNVCNNTQFGEGLTSTNGCKASGSADVQTFFTDLGVTTNPSATLNNCSSESSTIDVSAKLAGPEDDLEIRPDSVRSFVIRGQTPDPLGCTVNLTAEARGSAVVGMLVTKYYGKTYVNGVATEYKAYEYNDTVSYCVHSDGSDCSADSRFGSSWTPLLSGSQISIPLSGSGTYSLDEIRVRSVGGVVSIKTSLSNANCIQNWEMIKMVVGANCTGSYRAKEIQLPQQEWALPIFDYAVYNANGTLDTE